MKKILKRGLSWALMLIMLAGLLPFAAFAAVDSSGKPTDLNNTLVLSIYTPEGSFPGEPAMHGSAEYISFNSSFAKTSASGTFKTSAVGELKLSVLDDLVQGTPSGNNTVWGVFSADGLKEKYFESTASIIQPVNEAKIIRVIKGNAVNGMSDEEILNKYEIIWYVIKLQHSPASNWWSRATTEWHIDGLIKEKQYISINYYGNGNTEGSAPDGKTNHASGDSYTILAGKNMKKRINGVYVDFLGWSAKADGSGEELAFYQPGDVINPTQNISLYAMWDTTTQYTATVNTYLDGVLTSDDQTHGTARELHLSTDNEHYHKLTEGNDGVYTAKITGNGKFHLYNKNSNGTYTQIGTHQLTIYNQNGSLDVHHYTVSYNANGGTFAADPGTQVYLNGDAVTAVANAPTMDGYRFLGWKDNNGNLINPGEAVTASINAPITLTAQWEKTVNVTVNVTINHEGGGGYDQAPEKDHVVLTVASRADQHAPYLEVGESLELNKTSHSGFQYSVDGNVTKYEGYTLADMPGGTVEYTAVTSKSGYDTTVTPHKDGAGNWIIDIEMIYNPSNFDLAFTVEVDDSVPNQYLPDAAIVKVTFWAAGKGCWEIITQQAGGEPGVRVAIDPATRQGSGIYPVWKYESNSENPYGYRVEVTSFVYPDGSIVRASAVETDVKWTDDVYTAVMDPVTGGQKYGTLDGAYYDKTTDSQKGDLNVEITMDLYDVIFDAQGGKVNGVDKQTVEDQYKIPGFKDYVPTREGGYTFDGWYLDAACTEKAEEGKDLTEDITLYAKWIEPLTISGTVSISGTYLQGGQTVSVHDIDRATEAVVVLQEIQNGTVYDVDSETVFFGSYKDAGSAEYSFAGIPNEGKSYQIHVLVLNYGTGYDNESDADSNFTAKEYAAVFGGDTTADVDAHLTFVPPSYDQILKVDATQIGAAFRPDEVLSEVMYRDTGDNHAFQRISQHDVAPNGVEISLDYNGNGSGTQSIWKWHTDGTLYDYQMNVTKVDGVSYDSDTAPFYITYAEAAYWNGNTNAPSGELKATLIPKQYLITYDLNGDGDEVTGVDKLTYEDEEGNVVTTDIYGVIHTWSFDTAINAVPHREGYTFQGWQADVADAYVDGKVPAAIHQEVTLTAQWKKNTYQVNTVADPAQGGVTSGDSLYVHGAEATITATAKNGYTFEGWYENGALVSKENVHRFQVYENREFVAKFTLNQHTVKTSALPGAGGTTSGDGTYGYGTEVTVTATLNPGYKFLGWYQNYDELVSEELSFQVVVDKNLEYIAKYQLCNYTVQTAADPAQGGTTGGDGTYTYNQTAIVTATANPGYVFLGWYDENGDEISAAEAYTFAVTSDCVLTAKFEQIVYQVTAKAEHGGAAEGTAAYHYGDSATVKATANATFTFDGWYEGENKVSDAPEYTFTVTSDRELTAMFIKNGYQVKADPEHPDYGTTTGSGYYEEGETATVVATPKEGYKFQFWSQGAEKVHYQPEYSFVVTENRELVAHFTPAYTVTTIASPAGAGTLTGGGQYTSDDTVTIKAVPNGSYYFVGWYDEKDELVSTDAEYTLLFKLTADRTFTAKFEKKVAYKCDFVYLFGYTDSEIGATGPLLRGELAQMIYRLVRQNGESKTYGAVVEGTAGEWFQSGMSYMEQVGAIGATKSSPYASVTCGETYKMICLGLGFTRDTSLDYSDYKAILSNSGMPAKYGVTSKIQRWQFCELFNAILGRSDYCLEGFFDTTGKEVTADDYGYTDLSPADDYYRIMMIATSTFDKYGRIDLVHRMERNYHDFTDNN